MRGAGDERQAALRQPGNGNPPAQKGRAIQPTQHSPSSTASVALW